MYLVDEPIETAKVVRNVLRDSDGAVVVFEGVVRNENEGKEVVSIFYDAYRPMAEKEMKKIADSVADHHPSVRVAFVHRLGLLHVGEASIVIACASPHRSEAFDACRETIDRVKQTVPIWKKEKSSTGEEWIGWQGRA